MRWGTLFDRRAGRIYRERGLAAQQGAVWLSGEHLTVHFAGEPLAQCTVAYEEAATPTG